MCDKERKSEALIDIDKVSVINVEGPPVPIPNTAVKLNRAYNTWLATAREDRSMLTQGSSVILVEGLAQIRVWFSYTHTPP